MTSIFKLKGKVRRLVAYGLAMALILSFGFTNLTAYADDIVDEEGAGFSDIEGHWAKDQILSWSEKGLVTGYEDGTFGPERGVTRAEFITFINRAHGLTERSGTSFSDVAVGDWFNDEVAKAVAAEYISGYDDGTMRPAAGISRLEAAVILYRLLRLTSPKSSVWVDGFMDSGAIAEWGKDQVNSAVAEGYLSGYPDGTFKPDNIITRAETVALLSKTVGVLYNDPGTYGPEGNGVIEGNVTVNVSGVTLKDLTIEGDLFLTAGIGDGDFNADGVTVKGRTIVGGGGHESIVFNNSSLGDVIVYARDGKVRVVAMGDTSIDDVILESGGFLQEENLTGTGFGGVQILVLKPGQEVELDGDFDWVSIETSVDMSVSGDTRIKELNVSEEADGTQIDVGKDAVIDTLTLDGGTDVTGRGTIKTANVNTDDYNFEKDPDKTVIAGEEPEEDKKKPGGSSGPSVRKVSAIGVKIDPDYDGSFYKDMQVKVTLSTTTDGATIYYTLDGEEPNVESHEYTESFVVTVPDGEVGTVVIKAIGMKAGYTNSAVITYNIKFADRESPTPKPAAFHLVEGDLLDRGISFVLFEIFRPGPDAEEEGEVINDLSEGDFELKKDKSEGISIQFVADSEEGYFITPAEGETFADGYYELSFVRDDYETAQLSFNIIDKKVIVIDKSLIDNIINGGIEDVNLKMSEYAVISELDEADTATVTIKNGETRVSQVSADIIGTLIGALNASKDKLESIYTDGDNPIMLDGEDVTAEQIIDFVKGSGLEGADGAIKGTDEIKMLYGKTMSATVKDVNGEEYVYHVKFLCDIDKAALDNIINGGIEDVNNVMTEYAVISELDETDTATVIINNGETRVYKVGTDIIGTLIGALNASKDKLESIYTDGANPIMLDGEDVTAEQIIDFVKGSGLEGADGAIKGTDEIKVLYGKTMSATVKDVNGEEYVYHVKFESDEDELD